jgi:hypothetical protein
MGDEIATPAILVQKRDPISGRNDKKMARPTTANVIQTPLPHYVIYANCAMKYKINWDAYQIKVSHISMIDGWINYDPMFMF